MPELPTIRKALTDLITAAWQGERITAVLQASGLSLDDMTRSQFVPSSSEIIGLSYQDSEFAEQYENFGGSDKPDGHNWTLSIRKRSAATGNGLAGINDDDILFALVMALAAYLRQHNRIATEHGKFRLSLTTTRIAPSLDMSYETFEIPITLR